MSLLFCTEHANIKCSVHLETQSGSIFFLRNISLSNLQNYGEIIAEIILRKLVTAQLLELED